MSIKRIIIIGIEVALWMVGLLICIMGFVFRYATENPDLITCGGIFILVGNCIFWTVILISMIVTLISICRKE